MRLNYTIASVFFAVIGCFCSKAEIHSFSINDPQGCKVADVSLRADGKGSVICRVVNGKNVPVGYTDSPLTSEKQIPPQLRELLSRPVAATTSVSTLAYNWTPPSETSYGEAVEPMIKTKWGQGWPYNTQCPVVNGSRTLAGCGAVAVAQFLKYYGDKVSFRREPNAEDRGLDDTDFDFDDMLDVYHGTHGGDNIPQKNIDAVAKLMYYAGVAIKTNYGISASSHSFNGISDNLRNYFGFKPGKVANGSSYKSADRFAGDIYKCLSNGNPVLYAANGKTGAHTFLCDGYRGDGPWFHYNFGWSGSCDGYYNFTQLSGESYDLSASAQAILGLSVREKMPDFGEPIEPMMTALWKNTKPYTDSLQTANRKYYSEHDCLHIAEICAYHRAPSAFYVYNTKTRSYEYVSVNYSLMFNSTDENPSAEQIAEVAKLIKLANLAGQNCAGTSAYETSFQPDYHDVIMMSSFKKNLRFPDAKRFLDRNSDVSQWPQIIYDELAEGRPVVYAARNGYSDKIFCIDGYLREDIFHVRWINHLKDNWYRLSELENYTIPRHLYTGLKSDVTESAAIDSAIADDCADDAACTVSNVAGTVVYTGPADAFDRSSLPSGIYIMRHGSSTAKFRVP